jgi:1-aminocyclopropane-1-carboxylate deaminase/D-cysteine desulfhydrase-like pyridoxal-dependent ACC family enzyme
MTSEAIMPDEVAPATHASAIARLTAWPRVSLANLPTRLLSVPRIADRLGCEHAYVKMDAETGFALGGNKVRKLEFELVPERLEDVTCLITAGGPQSNHCRVTAAFAARAGLDCILVTVAPEPDPPTGNALLHRLFGADFVTVPEREDRAPGMDLVARRVAAEGGKALVVPIGASTGLGSLGYALAALELVEQLDELKDGAHETLLFVSASSCGTLAGLLFGLALLERPGVRLFGVSADASAADLRAATLELAAEEATLLDASVDLTAISLETIDSQVGAGYGIPTSASIAATDDFGRLEGIVLDPTYTSKAAAGLIEWVERNGVAPDQRVVFLHTGGAPGLLA